MLRVLERLPVTVDSAVPNTLLRQAESGDVGSQARLAEDVYFGRREEDRLRRAGGDPLQEAGDWTRFLGQSAAPTQEVDAAGLERAAAGAMAALVPALDYLVRIGGGRAGAALKVLARIRVPESLELIRMAGATEILAPTALAALSTFGGDAAAGAAVEILRTHAEAKAFPVMLGGLRGLPNQETLVELSRVAGREECRIGVATALEGFGDFSTASVLDQLLETRDPWTLIHTIETMGRLGGTQLIGHLTGLFSKIQHPQVRVAILQAAAESRDGNATQVAIAGLACTDPMVRAAAVEAVVALPVPRKDYREQVLGLLDDPHPRLAMNAALACVVLDPKRAVKRVQQLLASGSPAHLVQGIHCLSYMEDRAAAGILRAIIQKAPAGAIRVQGVRALGRRASRDPNAVGALAALAAHADANVRVTAAWFLAGSHPATRGPAARALAQAMAAESEVGVRAVFAEAVGLAGPAAGEAVGALAKVAGEGSVASKSAAWALAVGFPDSAEAGQLSRSLEPGMKSRAVLCDWYQGRLGLEALGEPLSSTDPGEFLDAIEIARAIVVSGEFLGAAPTRLAPTAEALSRSATATGPDVLTAGRAAPAAAPRAAPDVQPQLMAQAGGELLSEAEAESVLENVKANSAEADAAVEQATYYQPESKAKANATAKNPAVAAVALGAPAEAPAAVPPPPGAPVAQKLSIGSLIIQGVQMVVFFGSAVMIGQFLKYLVLTYGRR